MSSNIFDEVAKGKRKPKTDKSLGTSKPRQISGSSELPAGEIGAMFDKMQKMREDLEFQLDNIRNNALSRQVVNVEKYFNNAHEMTKSEIEDWDRQKEVLSEKINKAIPSDSCMKRKSKAVMTEKERKSKFRGSRQKWIPMK